MGMLWRRFNFDARAVGAGLVGVTPIRKVVALGDSQVVRESSVTAPSQYLLNTGALVQLQAFCGGRFYFDHNYNLGVSGNTSAQILARLPSALATDADTLFTESGSNDDADVTHEQQWANLLATYQGWLAQRPNLLIRVVMQRAQSSWGTETATTIAMKDRNEATRQRQLAWAASMGPRVIAFDPVPLMNDPAGYRVAREDMFVDGRHVNARGAYTVASAGKSIVPARCAPADFDLNADPGTLLTNASLSGTGGSWGSTTLASGALPTGWTGARIRGAAAESGSLVSSKVARSDGAAGEWVALTANALTRAGSDGNEQYGLTQAVLATAGKYAAGDVIEMIGEVQVVANDGTLIAVTLDVQEADGVNTNALYTSQASNSGGALVVDDAPRVFRTPRLTVRTPGAGAQITFRLKIACNPRAGSSWQVRFGRMLARKVA